MTNVIIKDHTKKDCLKTSCAVETLALYNEYYATSIDSNSRRKEPKNLLEKPSFFEEIKRLDTFDKIKTYYMQEIFDHEKDIDIFDIAGEKDDATYEKRITIHLKKVIVKAALLYNCVNEGLTFCDGRPINYEDKSKTDCLLFWYQAQPLQYTLFPLRYMLLLLIDIYQLLLSQPFLLLISKMILTTNLLVTFSYKSPK